MVTVCHSSTLNSRLLDLNSTEQSENVYENKGPHLRHATSCGRDTDNMSLLSPRQPPVVLRVVHIDDYPLVLDLDILGSRSISPHHGIRARVASQPQ